MIEVSGKPFLHWLVGHFQSLGFKRFIISTGYKADVIEKYKWSDYFSNCHFDFVRETKPLGTGGAVSLILNTHKEIKNAWVANGDTLLPITPGQLSNLEEESNNFDNLYTALPEDLVFDAKPNLVTIANKVTAVGDHGSHFDGGLVRVSAKSLDLSVIPPCSLHEILAKSMATGGTGYSLVRATCYDIGTPVRLERFKNEYLKGLKS